MAASICIFPCACSGRIQEHVITNSNAESIIQIYADLSRKPDAVSLNCKWGGNASFSTQEISLQRVDAGDCTSLGGASLVKNAMTVIMEKYVKTGYSELAMMTTVVIFTHRTV